MDIIDLQMEYRDWLKVNDLPELDVGDMLNAYLKGEVNLHYNQLRYLMEFRMRWEDVA